MTANPFEINPFVQGFITHKFQARVVAIENEPKGPNGEPKKMRVRARIIGLQDDTTKIPDETLPWYDVLVPSTSQGTSPYYKPGMQIWIHTLGGAAGTTATAYAGEKIDYYPQNAAMQGEDKKFKTSSNEDYPPPGQEGEQVPTKSKKDVTKDKTTQQSREQDHPYIWAPTVKNRQKDPEQNFQTQENRFKEKKIKYAEDKTVGTHKFDNAKDAQKFIKNTINNQGAFIPTALQMIQNLKKVGNGQNPNSIKAVGAGNFFQALKDIAKHFQNNDKKDNPCALLDTNPESLPIEQRIECCKIDNRRNLTKKGKEYCEYLDSIQLLSQEDSEFEVSENIEDIDTGTA